MRDVNAKHVLEKSGGDPVSDTDSFIEEVTEEVVDEAIDNAEVEESTVAATTEAEEATVFEKYKNAFSIDNFDLNN